MYNLKNLIYTAVLVYAVYIVFEFILVFFIELPIDLFKEFKKK